MHILPQNLISAIQEIEWYLRTMQQKEFAKLTQEDKKELRNLKRALNLMDIL